MMDMCQTEVGQASYSSQGQRSPSCERGCEGREGEEGNHIAMPQAVLTQGPTLPSFPRPPPHPLDPRDHSRGIGFKMTDYDKRCWVYFCSHEMFPWPSSLLARCMTGLTSVASALFFFNLLISVVMLGFR